MDDDGLSAVDRRALTSVAVQFFVNGMLFASFVPRLPEIRDRIDIDNDTLGLLLALGGLSGVLGSVAVGRLVERFGTRRLLLVAGVLLCASLSIIGVATVPAVLVIGLAAMSIFDVFVDTSMNLQGSWISGRRTAPVMNRLHGLWSLGTVVGGVGASQLAGIGVSLQVHLFVVAGILLAAVAFVGAGLLRDDEYVVDTAELDSTALDSTALDSTAASSPTAGTPGAGAVGAGVRMRWLRGPLMLFAVLSAASIAMEMTSSDWAAFRLSDDFGATAGFAGLAYVAFTAGMTVGRFGGDSAIVHFGGQRVADWGIWLSIAGLATASFAPVQWLVLLGYVIAGLGIATQFPKLYDDAAKYPGRPGAGLGALTGGSRIALLITPIAVGTLASSRLSVGEATAVVTLTGAFVFLLLSRRTSTASAT